MRVIPCLIVILATYSQTSAAQSAGWDEHPWLHSKFRLTPGLFFAKADTEIRVNGNEAIRNPDIDLDERFGVSKDEDRFAGELLWRFGDKWSVAIQYLDSKDGSKAVLEEDIEWKDYVLQSGSSASVGQELNIYRVFMGRKFVDGLQNQFGAGLGFHWLDLGFFVEGEFFLNGESTGVRRESVSASAPLPNLGAWYDHAFNARWAFNSRVDWLSASIDEYSGSITNASIGVNYQAWRHLAFGVNYNYFRINVDVDKRGWKGGLEYERQGPFVYANFTW